MYTSSQMLQEQARLAKEMREVQQMKYRMSQAGRNSQYSRQLLDSDPDMDYELSQAMAESSKIDRRVGKIPGVHAAGMAAPWLPWMGIATQNTPGMIGKVGQFAGGTLSRGLQAGFGAIQQSKVASNRTMERQAYGQMGAGSRTIAQGSNILGSARTGAFSAAALAKLAGVKMGAGTAIGGAVNPLLGGLGAAGLVSSLLKQATVAPKIARLTARRQTGNQLARKNSLSNTLESQMMRFSSAGQLQMADQMMIRLLMWTEGHTAALPLMLDIMDLEREKKEKGGPKAGLELDKIMYGADAKKSFLWKGLDTLDDTMQNMINKFDPITQMTNFLLTGKRPSQMLKQGMSKSEENKFYREEEKIQGIRQPMLKLLDTDAVTLTSVARSAEEQKLILMMSQYDLARLGVQETITMRKGLGVQSNAFHQTGDYGDSVFSRMVEGIRTTIGDIPGLNALTNIATIIPNIPKGIMNVVSNSFGFVKEKLFGQGFIDAQDTELVDKKTGLYRSAQDKAYAFLGGPAARVMEDLRVVGYKQYEVQENVFGVMQQLLYVVSKGKLQYEFQETRKKEKQALAYDNIRGAYVTQDAFEKQLESRMLKRRLYREGMFRKGFLGTASQVMDFVKSAGKATGGILSGEGGILDFYKMIDDNMGNLKADEKRMEWASNLYNELGAMAGQLDIMMNKQFEQFIEHRERAAGSQTVQAQELVSGESERMARGLVEDPVEQLRRQARATKGGTKSLILGAAGVLMGLTTGGVGMAATMGAGGMFGGSMDYLKRERELRLDAYRKAIEEHGVGGTWTIESKHIAELMAERSGKGISSFLEDLDKGSESLFGADNEMMVKMSDNSLRSVDKLQEILEELVHIRRHTGTNILTTALIAHHTKPLRDGSTISLGNLTSEHEGIDTAKVEGIVQSGRVGKLYQLFSSDSNTTAGAKVEIIKFPGMDSGPESNGPSGGKITHLNDYKKRKAQQTLAKGEYGIAGDAATGHRTGFEELIHNDPSGKISISPIPSFADGLNATPISSARQAAYMEAGQKKQGRMVEDEMGRKVLQQGPGAVGSIGQWMMSPFKRRGAGLGGILGALGVGAAGVAAGAGLSTLLPLILMGGMFGGGLGGGRKMDQNQAQRDQELHAQREALWNKNELAKRRKDKNYKIRPYPYKPTSTTMGGGRFGGMGVAGGLLGMGASSLFGGGLASMFGSLLGGSALATAGMSAILPILLPMLGMMGGASIMRKLRESREKQQQDELHEQIKQSDFEALSLEDKLVRVALERYELDRLFRKEEAITGKRPSMYQNVGGLQALKNSVKGMALSGLSYKSALAFGAKGAASLVSLPMALTLGAAAPLAMSIWGKRMKKKQFEKDGVQRFIQQMRQGAPYTEEGTGATKFRPYEEDELFDLFKLTMKGQRDQKLATNRRLKSEKEDSALTPEERQQSRDKDIKAQARLFKKVKIKQGLGHLSDDEASSFMSSTMNAKQLGAMGLKVPGLDDGGVYTMGMYGKGSKPAGSFMGGVPVAAIGEKRVEGVAYNQEGFHVTGGVDTATSFERMTRLLELSNSYLKIISGPFTGFQNLKMPQWGDLTFSFFGNVDTDKWLKMMKEKDFALFKPDFKLTIPALKDMIPSISLIPAGGFGLTKALGSFTGYMKAASSRLGKGDSPLISMFPGLGTGLSEAGTSISGSIDRIRQGVGKRYDSFVDTITGGGIRRSIKSAGQAIKKFFVGGGDGYSGWKEPDTIENEKDYWNASVAYQSKMAFALGRMIAPKGVKGLFGFGSGMAGQLQDIEAKKKEDRNKEFQNAVIEALKDDDIFKESEDKEKKGGFWDTIKGFLSGIPIMAMLMGGIATAVAGFFAYKTNGKVGGKALAGLAQRATRTIAGSKIGTSIGSAAVKVGAKAMATETGAKVATKVASTGGAKLLAKLGTKAGVKTVLKNIPGLGMLFGIGFALHRLSKGDIKGAAIDLASGFLGSTSLLSFGTGTAASVGLDLWNAKRDFDASKKMATGGMVPPGGFAVVGDSRDGRPTGYEEIVQHTAQGIKVTPLNDWVSNPKRSMTNINTPSMETTTPSSPVSQQKQPPNINVINPPGQTIITDTGSGQSEGQNKSLMVDSRLDTIIDKLFSSSLSSFSDNSTSYVFGNSMMHNLVV